MKPAAERRLQRDIEAALGAEPDLLLLRNSVGRATHVSPDGRSFHVPYGLGVGSPDLVGLLRARGVAVWFCLEVKTRTGRLSPEQVHTHAVWRSFGAFIAVVRSVDDARAALSQARSRGTES